MCPLKFKVKETGSTIDNPRPTAVGYRVLDSLFSLISYSLKGRFDVDVVSLWSLFPWLQVLQHVRLPLMSPKFLVGTVGADLLVKSDDSCRDLVDEAKNYLLLPQERPLMQGPRTRPRKPIRCGEVLFAGTVALTFFGVFKLCVEEVGG